ncbi:hypothetical protein PG990_001612 [Apiospora arundinis]|uniref:Uncharacterized protein n=1 Tax=Apiospora arundinis TaxID=335852 RepID=A0ABR2HRR3_9PEZI
MQSQNIPSFSEAFLAQYLNEFKTNIHDLPPILPTIQHQPQLEESHVRLPTAKSSICLCASKGMSWDVKQFTDPRVGEDGVVLLTAHWENTVVRVDDLTTGFDSCKNLITGMLGEKEWHRQQQYLRIRKGRKQNHCQKKRKGLRRARA